MALRRQDLLHVPLDVGCSPPALVQPIEDEQRAPRHHRLPQGRVQCVPRGTLAVLEIEVGVHPVPLGGKRVGGRIAPLALQETGVQPVHLRAGGGEVQLGTVTVAFAHVRVHANAHTVTHMVTHERTHRG